MNKIKILLSVLFLASCATNSNDLQDIQLRAEREVKETQDRMMYEMERKNAIDVMLRKRLKSKIGGLGK